MASINYATREISCKIVYYGPGLSGKTTNLQIIHRKIPDKDKSEMVSLATETDRTLFFDFLPLDLGSIKGFSTKFQLYTVPGQVYYNATRKLVLRGVDGVVFVADSQTEKKDENLESFANLEENLQEYGYSHQTIPFILQYNKRDLPNIMSVDELNRDLNKYNLAYFEAVASTGVGVFTTLKATGKAVIDRFNAKYSGQSQRRAKLKPAARPVNRPPQQPPASSPGSQSFRQTPARTLPDVEPGKKIPGFQKPFQGRPNPNPLTNKPGPKPPEAPEKPSSQNNPFLSPEKPAQGTPQTPQSSPNHFGPMDSGNKPKNEGSVPVSPFLETFQKNNSGIQHPSPSNFQPPLMGNQSEKVNENKSEVPHPQEPGFQAPPDLPDHEQDKTREPFTGHGGFVPFQNAFDSSVDENSKSREQEQNPPEYDLNQDESGGPPSLGAAEDMPTRKLPTDGSKRKNFWSGLFDREQRERE